MIPDFVAGTPENGAWWGIATRPFKRKATGVKVPFHNSITGNFMV